MNKYLLFGVCIFIGLISLQSVIAPEIGIITNSMVSAGWKLDNNGNEVKGVYNGTLIDSTYTNYTSPGKNGSNLFIKVPTNTGIASGIATTYKPNVTNKFTINFWIKKQSSKWGTPLGSREHLIVAYKLYSVNAKGTEHGADNGKLSIGVYDTSDKQINHPRVINDNQWHMVTAYWSDTDNLMKLSKSH